MRSKATLAAFLTTEEALTCLKVNPRTIYRLIKTGELPAVRIVSRQDGKFQFAPPTAECTPAGIWNR